MKVKVYVTKMVEVEIDDKFRKLAVPVEKIKNIPEGMYEEATQVVEKATGEKVCSLASNTGIAWVVSAENNETMLEY